MIPLSLTPSRGKATLLINASDCQNDSELVTITIDTKKREITPKSLKNTLLTELCDDVQF